MEEEKNKRNTKKIITPIDKYEIVLVDNITGGEYEEIQRPITDIKLMVDVLGATKGEINAGEVVRKSTETAIKIVVVSIDGEKKDILEKIMAMHKNDYLFVLEEVDKIVKGENFTKP